MSGFRKIARKWISIVALFAAGLSVSYPAAANGLVWTGPVRITALTPTAGGFVWVEIDTTTSCASVGGPSGVGAVMLHPEANFTPYEASMNAKGYETIYSTMLTALMTGASVSFQVGPAAANGPICYIERLKIIPTN